MPWRLVYKAGESQVSVVCDSDDDIDHVFFVIVKKSTGLRDTEQSTIH